MSNFWSLVFVERLFYGSIIATLLYQLHRNQNNLNKLKLMRKSERQGRINLEKKKRERQNHQISEQNGKFLRIIGYIHTPFIDRRGTPRQPILVPEARGVIKFNKTYINKDMFQEIKDFSHIWIIFLFHDNTSLNDNKKTVPAKIAPPRLMGKKVGCLSTRSPHRPNAIGLSVCEVESVGNNEIYIKGIDMVNETPILDIKPYIPYDIIPSNISLPMMKGLNELDEKDEEDGSRGMEQAEHKQLGRMLEVPVWITESEIKMRPVHFSNNAEENIAKAHDQIKSSKRFCQTQESTKRLITQVLRQDPRDRKNRGTTTTGGDSQNNNNNNEIDNSKSYDISAGDEHDDNGNLYHCRLDSLLLSFVVEEDRILVTKVSLE